MRLGPNGHGKSLLCHQCMEFSYNTQAETDLKIPVGELLDLPTHTVNMASLHSSIDLWQSLSMSVYEVGLRNGLVISLTMLTLSFSNL